MNNLVEFIESLSRQLKSGFDVRNHEDAQHLGNILMLMNQAVMNALNINELSRRLEEDEAKAEAQDSEDKPAE